MKKLAILSLLILLVCVFAGVANATLIVGPVMLGGENEEKSNPNSDQESERDVRMSGTVSVTNDGAEPVNLTTLTLAIDNSYGDNLGFGPSGDTEGFKTTDKANQANPANQGYAFKIEGSITSPVEIAAGGSISLPITISARAVKDFPAVEYRPAKADTFLDTRSWHIGKLKANAVEADIAGVAIDTIDTSNSYISMQVENKLEIENAKICVENDPNSDCNKNYKDASTIKDLKPGNPLGVVIEIKNKFKEDSNIEIGAASIALLSEDDDIIDVDEEDSIDLSPDEDGNEVEFSTEIEDDASGQAKLAIRAYGQDDNGAWHGEEWKITLEVKREAHEIDITGATLTPSLISCEAGSNSVQMSVNIRNIGKNKEKEVKVEAKANKNSFNIQESKTDLELDKDDSYTAMFIFQLPKNLAPDTYPIEINTYYKASQLSHSKSLMLTVPNCGQQEEVAEDNTKNNSEVVVTQTGTAGTPVTGTPATAAPIVTKATQTGFRNSTTYVALLVGVIVVLLTLGGILVALIVKKN